MLNSSNQPGRNQVKFIVYDCGGTRTEASWGGFFGTVYVIAQNTGFDPFIAEMRINGTSEQEVKVVFENRVIPLKDGKFIDAFMVAGIRLYCIDLTDD